MHTDPTAVNSGINTTPLSPIERPEAAPIKEIARPKGLFRLAYKAPVYFIDKTDLTFNLHPTKTTIEAKMAVRRSAELKAGTPLFLDGTDQKLLEVSINGVVLERSAYKISKRGLTLCNPPEDGEFELGIKTRINPTKNESSSGLYGSYEGKLLSTQMEPQGFRKMLYYPDRPDVESVFTVRLNDPEKRFPVLLSNGVCTESGNLGEKGHYAVFVDEHPKPSYLFAVVAGNLDYIERLYTTGSGKDVTLRLYSDYGNAHRCSHAAEALVKALQWDEKRNGLEYDSSVFSIVAVDAFNIGAMENKGLNIFNAAALVGDYRTATDSTLLRITQIVAHEEFHNWTGNRVTVRSLFDLTLKEGWTVLRDQWFMEDEFTGDLQRIKDVKFLRSKQYPEDSGPQAHPIRPEEVVEINNFYTPTIYRKGAAVIRMMHTLIGEDAFQRGSKLFFERHDNTAVTCDEFLAAMSDASGYGLEQFQRWYSQAGTPELTVTTSYDKESSTYEITLSQDCAPTADKSPKEPFVIPFSIGLVGPDGYDIPLTLEGESDEGPTTRILELNEKSTTYRFSNVTEKPIPSLLRDESAPVKINYEYTTSELEFLIEHDSNFFKRWDSTQTISKNLILSMAKEITRGENGSLPESAQSFIEVLSRVMRDSNIPAGHRAELLNFPPLEELAESMSPIDYQALAEARDTLRTQVAISMVDDLKGIYKELDRKDQHLRRIQDTEYVIGGEAMGERALKNLCLSYLALHPNEEDIVTQLQTQQAEALNMTDEFTAYSLLCDRDPAVRLRTVEEFEKKWKENTIVMNDFFLAQTQADHPDVRAATEALLSHPSFDIKNPNKVRAVLTGFAANLKWFHGSDDSGYKLI
ncbi:MAG: aminopeptidase N, partial [Chloroflexota bacterium]|nr:aminopeptidase N [Chloroflexota bacterium]